jgi:hypothetical protein
MLRNVLCGKNIVAQEFPDVGGLTLAEVESKCKGFFTGALENLKSAENSMRVVTPYCEGLRRYAEAYSASRRG